MASETITVGSGDAENSADGLTDQLSGMIRDLWREASRGEFNRRTYSGLAMNIPEDRYSAGSTAARCAVAILLRHGVKAAEDFVADLEHHEG